MGYQMGFFRANKISRRVHGGPIPLPQCDTTMFAAITQSLGFKKMHDHHCYMSTIKFIDKADTINPAISEDKDEVKK